LESVALAVAMSEGPISKTVQLLVQFVQSLFSLLQRVETRLGVIEDRITHPDSTEGTDSDVLLQDETPATGFNINVSPLKNATIN
jgi:hypothetical protein